MQDDSPQAGWVYTPGDKGPGEKEVVSASSEQLPPATNNHAPTESKRPKGARASWSASEYIANPKNAGWFGILAIGSLVLSVVVYFLTKDIISSVVIIALGITVGVFGARQPHVLEYHLDENGIHVGAKFYPYVGFKSFSVIKEGAFPHIFLLPAKRFMPPLSIHFSPEDEDMIAETLSDYLPYEQRKLDVIDNLSRRLKF